MTWLRKRKGLLFCSFCRKADHEVDRLVGGPGVYICGNCVERCVEILKPHQGKKFPDFAGWDSQTDAQLLRSLAPTEKTLEDVRGEMQNKIDLLRKRGVSWENIGKSLGISRQAAWERFS